MLEHANVQEAHRRVALQHQPLPLLRSLGFRVAVQEPDQGGAAASGSEQGLVALHVSACVAMLSVRDGLWPRAVVLCKECRSWPYDDVGLCPALPLQLQS